MHIVNNSLETRRPLSIQQFIFMIVKGLGHIVTMVGVVYVIASVMHLAVGTVSFMHVITGFLMIACGYQLQQLGDKLDIRLVTKANHLTIEIKQHITRVLTITMVVTTILFI